MRRILNTTEDVCLFITAHLQDDDPPCIIVHGEIGAGKTQFASRLVQTLDAHGVMVGGIIAPRIMDHGETIGYRVQNIATGEERPLAGTAPPGVPIGKFYLAENGLAFAEEAIVQAAREAQVVFVDEVGRLELSGMGHARAVRVLLSSRALPVLLVRSAFVDEVIHHFAVKHYLLFPVDKG